MRAVFGLAGLLIVLGVIVWIMKSTTAHDQQAIKTGQAVREQMSQVAGRDADGAPASASAVFDPMSSGGKTTALLVTKVVADGAYEKFFGLQRNDTIVAIEFQGYRQNIKDIGDPELAKAQVMETFQKSGSIYVMRNGKEVKLPAPKVAEAPAAGQDTHTAPAEKKSAMDRALAPIQSLQKQE